MAIVRRSISQESISIPNELIDDHRLKYKDLGLMVFLLSKGESYEINTRLLRKECGFGKDQIHSIFNRLRKFGYVTLVSNPYGIKQWFIRSSLSTDWSEIIRFKQENKYKRPPIYEWNKTRARIFLRDKNTCFYCGYVGLNIECDHYLPISRGGSNSDDNLVTACKPCNRKKKSMMPETFIKLLGGRND